MWLRRLTSTSYGRVLQTRSTTTSLAKARAIQISSALTMQLRTRSSAAVATEPPQKASPRQSPTAAKRTRTKATSASKSDDVRESEATDEVPSGRRSSRKRMKAEEAVETEDMAAAQEEQAKARPKRKTLVVKRGKDGRPEKWEKVMEGIKEMRAAQVADVDVAGAETMFEKGAFPDHIARFHILISAMLSSQTKDPVNAAAMKRLIARGLTVQDMLDIDEKELAQLIHPVGFFNNKARYIKQVAQILMDKADDRNKIEIPDTFDELVALPGVGPKMAHLIMTCAWDNTVGICVDTHVHRISNRLGWVNTWNKKNPKAQDPEKTRKELEDWLPREHWGPINVMLVGFGQTVCFPRGPKCSECKVQDLCPSAFSSVI